MKKFLPAVLCSTFFLLLLIFRFEFLPQAQNFQDGEQVSFTGRLYKEPQRKNNLQRFSLTPAGKREISMTTPLIPSFHYGEKVKVTGTVKARMLDSDELVFSIYFPKVARIADSESVFPFITKLRLRLVSLFSSSLPEPGSALLVGIVFGIKMPMAETFFQILKDSGVLHVIAASGMNVVFVSSFLFTFHRVFFSRRIAHLLTLFGLVFYTVLSGLEPSIIRASIMASGLITASLFGRQYTGSLILFFTAYGMLLYNPMYIVDLGFQLSFLATIGIMFVKPPLTALLPQRMKNIGFIRDDFLSTLSAQLTTFPLLFFTFGTYNLMSLVINALVLWTIPYLMVIGGFGAIVGLLVKPLGTLILWLSIPLLEYFFYRSCILLFIGIRSSFSKGTVCAKNFS